MSTTTLKALRGAVLATLALSAVAACSQSNQGQAVTTGTESQGSPSDPGRHPNGGGN
jgi:hypothetical protein